jgi:alpha-1,3-glucan synthase
VLSLGSLLIGLQGQIIAANSYQITLLVGQVGQPASKLYAVATIYLVTSIVWWFVYRSFKAVYVLSLPFAFYGFAFVLVGVAPFVEDRTGKGWVQNVATGCYAAASSSGAMFFALNFGDQGGAPVTSWMFRACVIQGTQQIYIAGLWWWGSTLAKLTSQGLATTSLVATKPAVVTSVGVSIALLMWAIGVVLFFGLPDYYRQAPGKVPSFLTGIFRRKIVLWFFMMVVCESLIPFWTCLTDDVVGCSKLLPFRTLRP